MRLLVLAIAAIFRPKALLIAENLCLRQQLVVLQRRHPRPRLSDADRRFWILASRWFSDWRHPLLIVKPETVLGWQRAGWRAYRKWRSSHKEKDSRPALPVELQTLIARMATENRLWGARSPLAWPSITRRSPSSTHRAPRRSITARRALRCRRSNRARK